MSTPSSLPLLRRLWAQVLNEEESAIPDDAIFFDLGGDSLTASELVDAAEEQGLLFTVEDLFNNPHLQSLASLVKTDSSGSSFSSTSSLLDTDSSIGDGLSQADVIPTDGLIKLDTAHLTPRQKQLVLARGHQPLENMCTWRRARLNVEVPWNRIKQAFDDIVRVQTACRVILTNAEAKGSYHLSGDMNYANNYQYRFQHSLYCDLAVDAIQKIEKDALSSLSLQDGPVFSVDVYRSQGGLNLFLAASTVLFDESSWSIILDDFDKAISDKRRPLKSLRQENMCQIQMQMQTQVSMRGGEALSAVDLSSAGEDQVNFWGLSWAENCPDWSITSVLGEEQAHKQDLGAMKIEDATVHVLRSFCARFGRRTAELTVEKRRARGLERAVGNFQETTLRWSSSEGVGDDDPRWRILREDIQGKLYDARWTTPATEEAKHSEALAPPDLAIYVSKQTTGLRAERDYSVVYDIQRPCDRPGEFANTWHEGFVQVYLSCSSTGNLQAVCNFDHRNSHATALRSWAENLGMGEYTNTSMPIRDQGPGQEDKTSIAGLCKVRVDQIEDIYPCTPMQESLAAAVDGPANHHVMQLVFRVAEHMVDSDSFKRAWEETIQANAILRTRICQVYQEGSATDDYVQVVLDEPMRWHHAAGQRLQQYLDEDERKPMSLGDPFFRYAMVEEATGDEHACTPSRYFVWTAHHALCDGASILTILDEVSRRAQGQTPRVREPFETFVRSPAVQRGVEEERGFWQKALSGLDPVSYPQPSPAPDFVVAPTATLEHSLTLDKLPSHGITKALFLRAVWALLMSHYTGTEDVCFGAVNSGRIAAVPGVAHMAGPTINVVPVAFHVDPLDTVGSFLSRFRAQAAEMMAFEHSGVSRIRRMVHRAGNHASATDFKSLLVVHPEDFDSALQLPSSRLGLEYLTAVGKKEQHPYPLVLSFTMSTTAAISLVVQYDERVLSTPQADTLVHHFQTLLTALASAGPDLPLASVTPLSDHDLAQIARWNASTPPVEATCVDSLFRGRVAQQPDAVAVCTLEQSLTYSEVDFYSSLLAARLVELAVQPGGFVGVCFEKSIWTVVAIMAVFKAGAVYVPIDPGHPLGRIKEVVATVAMQVALASPAGARLLQGICSRVVVVDTGVFGSATRADETQEVPSRSTPSGIAYLLFTSGSTGKPKGILISHDAICTSIKHHGTAFGAGPHWRTFQFCAHTFDMSIGEFLTTLAYGGCICVPSEEDRMNDLAGSITALKANTLLVVPTVANLLRPADVPTLKTLVLGGEPVTRETVKRWAAHVDLTCSYGPSETSVWCAANTRVSSDAHPANIGHRIGGTMWIVQPDDYRRLSALGCVGEIVISGGIVGRGYFRDETTTANSFVPAPDWLREMSPSSLSANGGSRVYKSGDLARYNPDGTLSIVGRLHTQVKLRGFRVELGEIENQIMTTGVVTAALAALPRAGPCADQIVAVVSSTPQGLDNHDKGDVSIASEDSRPVVDTLVSHLQSVLPLYMVPTVWVVVERMPLLISGKVDRKAIQTWIQAMDEETYERITPQMNELENAADELIPGSVGATLRGIWAEVFAIEPDRIRLRTSFLSLGGDSLAAMKVASRAKALGLSVTVRSLISSAHTLGSLISLVEKGMSAHAADAVAEGPNVDWQAETATQLPRPWGMARTFDESQECPEITRKGAIVLLTGATGFFGRALVRTLQEHSDVDEIHCLAVRNTTSSPARQLVHACSKVRLYAGDLSQARLGLSEDDSRRLFSTADFVIHNGAEISFLKGYEALRAPNVGSTRELVRLSLAHGGINGSSPTSTGCSNIGFRPSLHYVSGTGVAALALIPPPPSLGDNRGDPPPSPPGITSSIAIKPASLSSQPPPLPIRPIQVAPGKVVHVDGYVASKWASEVLIERAAAATRDRGTMGSNAVLDTHIYRLSNVTGPDAPELDLVHNLLRISRAMRAVPKLRGWSGRFDLISVDTAARALVQRMIRPWRTPEPPSSGSGSGLVEFVHLSGEAVVPVPELKSYLERDTGETFAELELEEWVADALNFGLPEALEGFLSTLVDGDFEPFLPNIESSIF